MVPERATTSDVAADLPTTPGVAPSRWGRLARRLAPSFAARLGWGISILVLLVAVFGSAVAPYPADIAGTTNILASLLPPSPAHLFGTNEVGQDVLSLTLAGARTSLLIAFSVVTLAALLGTLIGLAAGYFGGMVYHALMGLTDIFLALPALVLAITFAGLLGPGLWQLITAVTLVWWPGFARLVAAEVHAVREREFVEAARASGANHWRVAARHVLPSVLSPIIVKASLDLGYVILTAAGLGFVGLGVQPPTPEWGAMIADSRQYMIEAWWYTFFPGMAIFVTIMGLNLAGDAIRDALDPHLVSSAPGS